MTLAGSRFLTVLLGGASGLGAAIIGSQLTLRHDHPAPQSALSSSPEPRSSDVTPPSSGDPEAIAALERRMAMLEARPSPQPATNASASAPAQPRPSPEEVKAVWQARHESLAVRFRGEGSDPAWSNSATAAFQRDLTAVAKAGGFELDAVECRTTICEGRATWPNYSAAMKAHGAILNYKFEENCRRAIFTPEPADASAPYEAEVFFDCESLRGGS